MHTYNLDGFLHDGYQLSYTGDERYTYRLGVDVSEHQGDIDWEKVKAAGYDFAFIRVGYRGYGEAGRLCTDAMFHQNIVEAQSAGIDVGVYFFAQAVNEAEAEEEADLVLQQLAGTSFSFRWSMIRRVFLMMRREQTMCPENNLRKIRRCSVRRSRKQVISRQFTAICCGKRMNWI